MSVKLIIINIQRGAIYLAQLHAIIKKQEVARKRNLDEKRGREPSPFSNKDEEQEEKKFKDEKFKNWTRGSWFPPSDVKDTPFAGDLPAFFLSPLPSSTTNNQFFFLFDRKVIKLPLDHKVVKLPLDRKVIKLIDRKVIKLRTFIIFIPFPF